MHYCSSCFIYIKKTIETSICIIEEKRAALRWPMHFFFKGDGQCISFQRLNNISQNKLNREKKIKMKTEA